MCLTSISSGNFAGNNRVFPSIPRTYKKKSEVFKITGGTTVRDVLERVTSKYGEELHSILFDRGGNIREYVRVLMNGRDIQSLEGLYTKLEANCTISLFPPVGGG